MPKLSILTRLLLAHQLIIQTNTTPTQTFNDDYTLPGAPLFHQQMKSNSQGRRIRPKYANKFKYPGQPENLVHSSSAQRNYRNSGIKSKSGLKPENQLNSIKKLTSAHSNNPYLQGMSQSINKREPLSGSISSLSRNLNRSNSTVILMGRSVVLCKEPNKSWDTLKITVKSPNGKVKCRKNVCGYLTRSSRNTVVVKYLDNSFKQRGTWSEKVGSLTLDKILVSDEASYTCTFSYITEPNRVYKLNMSVIAPPRSSIIEASVLVDRQYAGSNSLGARSSLNSVNYGSNRASIGRASNVYNSAARTGSSNSNNRYNSIAPSSQLIQTQAGAVNIYVCKAANAKPQANIFWRWENMKKRPLDWHEQIEVTSGGISGKLKTVTNTLIFTPRKEYDRQKILCVVEHEGLATGRWTQTKQLQVQYKPSVRQIKRSGVNELTCIASGNPPPQVAWTFTRPVDRPAASSSFISTNSLFSGLSSSSRHHSVLTQKVSGNKINLFHNKISPNDTIQCVAENPHGVEYKSVLVSSLINSYGRSKMWTFFKYVLVFFIVAVVLSIIIFKVKQKFMPHRDKNLQNFANMQRENSNTLPKQNGNIQNGPNPNQGVKYDLKTGQTSNVNKEPNQNRQTSTQKPSTVNRPNQPLIQARVFSPPELLPPEYVNLGQSSSLERSKSPYSQTNGQQPYNPFQAQTLPGNKLLVRNPNFVNQNMPGSGRLDMISPRYNAKTVPEQQSNLGHQHEQMSRTLDRKNMVNRYNQHRNMVAHDLMHETINLSQHQPSGQSKQNFNLSPTPGITYQHHHMSSRIQDRPKHQSQPQKLGPQPHETISSTLPRAHPMKSSKNLSKLKRNNSSEALTDFPNENSNENSNTNDYTCDVHLVRDETLTFEDLMARSSQPNLKSVVDGEAREGDKVKTSGKSKRPKGKNQIASDLSSDLDNAVKLYQESPRLRSELEENLNKLISDCR